MKKIICFLLVLCFALSTFTVFASANENQDGEESKTDNLNIFYNRTFDEGWTLSNGINIGYKRNAIFDIIKERSFDFSSNYHAYIESSGEGTNDYMTMSFGSKIVDSGKLFIEYDIAGERGCDVGGAFLLITKTPKDKRVYFQSFENGNVVLFGEVVDTCDEQFAHVAIEIDNSIESESGKDFKCTAIYTKAGKEPVTVTKTYTAGDGGVGIRELRLGYHGGCKKSYWYGFDNLQIYSGVDKFTDLPKDNFGTMVNENKEHDFPIEKNDGSGLSFFDKIDRSLVMKKNVEWCLLEGKRQGIIEKNGKIYGEPREIDGKIYVSLNSVLNFYGYRFFMHDDGYSYDISSGDFTSYISVGRDSAIVNGNIINLDAPPTFMGEGDCKYIAISLYDIEKVFKDTFVYCDGMGLIIITQIEDLVKDENISLESKMEVMRRFIFDDLSESQAYELAKERTNNFTHPYLMANQEKFDNLKKVYNAIEGEENFDPKLKTYINNVVMSGIGSFNKYAEVSPDGKYIGIKPERIPVNRNYEKQGDGYDVGGRLYVPSEMLISIAFAYQMTGDEKYAHFVYDWILALGKWEHWGPGHFLNCADASNPVAISLDWVYSGLEKMGIDTLPAVETLYSHGVHMGFLATNDPSGRSIPYERKVGGNGACMYTMRDNNWNAVCTFGMLSSSLCILGETAKPEYRAESQFLLSNNLKTLEKYGLQLYAPDGSYIESAGYWSYGTTNFFKLVMILQSVYGDDFGLMDCWGIDKTCYFAYHAEDNDLHSFQYHDVGGFGSIDTSQFFFAGQMLNDGNIIAMRKIQLKNGKAPSIYDVLYYVKDSEKYENLELDYHHRFERCEGFVTRSSWERGAMYAGIMAGENSLTHTQNDCGAFVYHNRGKVFIRDTGAENYNAKNFWSRNYIYYRKNTEGNNTLTLKSIKYGQEVYAGGKITDTYANGHGNYVIMDNTPVFGDKASYWRRGMLTTNDRNTVVIQDEVSFKKIESVYWFAHYDLDIVDSVELSKDKRVAYLKSYDRNTSKNEVVRLSIVSAKKDLHFELMDCYTFVLDATVDRNWSTDNGGQPEKSRDNLRKLAIKCENTLSFDVAVAIELVTDDREKDVGYEFVPMNTWDPCEEKRTFDEENDNSVGVRKNARKTDIPLKIKMIDKLSGEGNIYGADIDRYYRLLTDLNYTCVAFENEDLNDDYKEKFKQKEKLLQEYEKFKDEANERLSQSLIITKRLFGL